ncbi:DNA methyltransferase [Maridesulfovibrio sp. FT414]|uniref:DNA methyltransferase n=1 Tax=Maridesulfovibrio sp. FT414 TaxID=2979469 RepID=UPI003D809D84
MAKNNRKMAYLPENALNAICPYFTMFPLEYPLKKLKNHRKEQPVIMDPFCGRGTTLFAARKLKMKAWGIDTSPIAVAIAKAKLAQCLKNNAINLARLLVESITPKNIPETPFFKLAYHEDTLKEICALREGLLNLEQETDESIILKAAILGCLHGPLSKTAENAGYFSNQMPRTYASKPDYAVRFWNQRELSPRKISTIEVIKRKIKRLTGLEDGEKNTPAQVIEGDAQELKTLPEGCKDFSIVVTSPPYYGMKTYVQDQWLRNWFLGGTPYVDYNIKPQLNHGGQEAFAQSLGKVWDNMAQSHSESLHMYVRFGVIPSATVDPKVLFRSSLAASKCNWKLVSTRSAKTAAEGKRQAGQMKAGSTAAVEYDFHVKRL